MCKEFEQIMKGTFEMSAIGKMNFFLGLQVEQKKDGFFIHPTKYAQAKLKRFGMEDTSPMDTPIQKNHQLGLFSFNDPKVDPTRYRAMIGSLMYLTTSRPDIMFAVCLCARYQSCPRESHMKPVKRILRYLKGQPVLGLWYSIGGDFEFMSYNDADYGGCNYDRKSSSGGCQFLGGRLVSWQCKKQTSVAISSCKAEYMATGRCCSQVLWIQQQLCDYGQNFLCTPIKIDNESTISITNNPVKHGRTKHRDIRFHFIRNCVEKKLIVLEKVPSDFNLADLSTKAFDQTRFELLVQLIGMRNL
uniref:uncharacterized mitochondrial protein AtMg00810-like n=1 Tax=Erigeron canadensis TaxID=72917 RepID=UPI001CB9BD62|nr:uncharacterized mitochondrial protein AtMg00810-like [Erigeron canadensis]